MNVEWLYVRTVLQEQGPLTESQIADTLTQFTTTEIRKLLGWAVDNDCLTVSGDRFELTERGRR